MLVSIVQMAMFILSLANLSNQVKFLQRNMQVKNPVKHTLCHPDSKLTFLDCCLQPWVQKSCVYCRQFANPCNGLDGTFDPTKIEDFSQFHKEDLVLDSVEENGDIGLQPISTYVSAATDPSPWTSTSGHDWMKRSTFSRAKLLPRVKQEISLTPSDKMSQLRLSFSKRNIIHELDQLKELRPLHKQFSSTQDMRTSVRKFGDKNRMYPIGYFNSSMTLTKLTNKDRNSELISELSIDSELSPVAGHEEMGSVDTESKYAPVVINPKVYLGNKEYKSRLINDSERRRKFMSKLHNFMKDRKKLEVHRGCEKSFGREDTKAAEDQQIMAANVKDTKTPGCIENKSKEYFNPRSVELVTPDVESMNSNDDRRELQFNPVFVADDPVTLRVQSVGSGETLVKRWGSLGAGKFRRWWFGN